MPGSVVTFYSYKGGVGRSFALANIAVVLAQWGTRVLMVDWDIEAPGLNHYFAPFTAATSSGVLDFLQDCMHGKPRPWTAYTTEIQLPNLTGPLHLMPAAAGGGTDYTALVQGLDWDALYTEHNLGVRLESLRAAWVKEFDLILLDSRTGVTDFSGLTTAQLPDILAFMFTANGQSLTGCVDIVRRAMEARRHMPVDRPALVPLPVPARFEQREEYDRARHWKERFVAELKPFLEVWSPQNVDFLKLIDLLTIPYVPRWTFGEELATLLEPAGSSGTRATGQTASYALETLAALLLQGFAKVDLLVSSRDEYVHAARSLAQSRLSKKEGTANVFVSYSRKDLQARVIVDRIAATIENSAYERGQLFSGYDANFPAGVNVVDFIQQRIELANAYIVIVGPSFSSSKWQQQETESFLRQSLRSDQAKVIVPIVLKGCEEAFMKSRLADYQAVFLDPSIDLEQQLEPVRARLRRLRP